VNGHTTVGVRMGIAYLFVMRVAVSGLVILWLLLLGRCWLLQIEILSRF
jgi:hypothetical protein